MKTRNWGKYRSILAICVPVVITVIGITIMLMHNNQSALPIPGPLEIIGEYSLDGENWHPLNSPEDIENCSSFDGEMVIRGHFNTAIRNGLRLNYYRNHIGVSMYINGELVYMDAQTEVGKPGIGLMDSMCGKEWSYLIAPDISTEDEVEIRLVNYHTFGNREAYQQFLGSICTTPDVDIILQGRLKTKRLVLQVIGIFMVTVSCMTFGAVISAFVLNRQLEQKALKTGLLTLTASGCFLFDSVAAFSLTDLVAANTYGSLLCIIFFVYFAGLLLVDELKGNFKKTVYILSQISLALDCIWIILACLGKVLLYDMLPYWVAMQWVLCPVLLICCVAGLRNGKKKSVFVSYIILFLAIMLDLTEFAGTMYSQTPCTQIVFLLLFFIYLVKTIVMMVQNYKTAAKVKMLESELLESRIAIMLSQIKPHFIYNTLGTIEQFCREDAGKAAELVHEFSLYLRGNFTELDYNALIPLAKEMEHVQHYVKIEQVRFPDIKVEYDLQTTDFQLPPLSVQPLVENAIKHGLMGLESGGKVIISTYETKEAYCVCVKDDGVGFDMTQKKEDKKHVGIRNIRGRVEGMCRGTLKIESAPGRGTTAIIAIPKEGFEVS